MKEENRKGGKMKNCVFVIALTLLVIVQQIVVEGFFLNSPKTVQSIQLIDADQNANIENIAQEVCRTIPPRNQFPKQLSRISTISKLLAFFKSVHDGYELARCAKYSLLALERFQELLSISNENVCSDKKISLLESYHRDFISTAFEHVAGKSNDELKTPNMIRIFFINYALEISATCRKSLLSNIQWDVHHVFSEAEYQFIDLRGVLDNILSILTIYEHPVQRVNDFEDLFISWDADLISMINTDKQDETNNLTGETTRLQVKVHDLGPIQRAQLKCRFEFKPLYTKLLTPIVRLANLGYSWKSGRFEREIEELQSSQMANDWYGAAQICEAILPIKFYQDKTLSLNEAQVINDEAAKRLVQVQSQLVEDNVGAKRIRRLSYEPVTNSMDHIDKLDWVGTEEALELVKQINLDKSQDERAMERTMEQIARNIQQSNH